MDFKVKMLHFAMKYISFPLMKMGGFNRARIDGMVPKREINGKEGITTAEGALIFDSAYSMDLTVPPIAKSVFEGIIEPAEIKLRFYRSETAVANSKKVPIVLYFHAGALVVGTNRDFANDQLCRNFVKNGDYVVASVDYRRTPEHPLPAAIDDCLGAVMWAFKNEHQFLQEYADTNTIILMGDSSGGYLAATISEYLLLNQPEVKIAHQILFYPGLHAEQETESRKMYANGYLSWKESSEFFASLYKPKNEELYQSYLYQTLKCPKLEGLPSTHIITAQCDMLTDDVLMFHELLKKAGVDTTYRMFENVPHGFATLDWLNESKQAFEEVHALLKQKLGNSTGR